MGPHRSRPCAQAARTCDAKLFYRENGYISDTAGDAYVQMLAMGGYMVEALACAQRPDGIRVESTGDLALDFHRTLEHLEGENVTLFHATLLQDRRLARVDIIKTRLKSESRVAMPRPAIKTHRTAFRYRPR